MRALLLSIGILFLVIFRASAQYGSTPASGHNPMSPSAILHSTDPINPQDGNASLGPTFQATACGLNYVTVSQKLGQRFSPAGIPQPASFLVSGIPAGCNPLAPPNILKAYIWADFSGNGIPVSVTLTDPNSVSTVFPMTIIGQDADKCWGYGGTYSYRVDVTSAIIGNGNYIMSGFPTNPPTSGNDVDGATLMIIYADPQATYQGTIDIWDGCAVGIGSNITQTINDFNACMTGSNARAFAIIADLQNVGTQFSFNGSPNFSYAFEDWWNFIDTTTTITAGQTTAAFSVISSGDCFNLETMGVYYQTTCQNCVPSASYTVACTSTASNCTAFNGTATVNVTGGNGPFSFTWNPSGQTSQTATNLGPGLYTVTIADSSGCTTQDTISVLGTGSMPFTSTSTNNLCFGDTIGTATFTPTGGTAPYTYVWTPNVSTTNSAVNLAAGVYSVDVTDNYGCTNSQTFTITEPPNVPIIGSITGSSPICTGQSANLSATATGGAPPYTYAWVSPAGTNPNITVSPITTTTYSVVVADACFTIPDTATFTVVVNALPVISFTGDNLDGCAPVCVNFTGSSVPALVTGSWNFGDNSSGSGANPYHCYLNSGQYDVTLTVNDINGCKDSLTIPNYIDVYPNPIAGFEFISENPATLLEATIAIDDLSTGGDTCYWDFGDGNLLTVVGCGDVSNAYSDTGAYHVTQIVVNNNGCSDTIAYDVYIIPYTTIYIPNTFSPNGNGVNDVFFVYGEYVDDFHMLVFDRWGNLIFESNDQLKGWDGKANQGNYLSQVDTYVYVVTYTEQHSARKHKLIGHVNLIR